MRKKEKLIKKYVGKLKNIAKTQDIEKAHCDADELLCDLLIELGYKKVTRIYSKIKKWYA